MELDVEFQIKANIDPLKKQLGSVGDDIEAQQKILNTSFKALNKMAEKFPGYFDAAKENAKGLAAYLDKISKQKTPFTLEQQSTVRAGFQQYAKSITSEPARMERDRKAAEKAVIDEQKATERAAKAEESAAKAAHANLIRARYALYDVAAEGRRVGLVMTGLGLAAIKVGADFETAFVDVQRTTGLTGTALGNLRDSLIEISQTSPISFKDIAAIATLGAQMGIASGNIDEFAATVTKFSAVTGVTAESAAMSFGKIAELLPSVGKEYDKLASSVLFVGRNSVATEEQILTLTSQIAASTNQAGFLASETVGLAASLASLAIPPEQARGVILRLFADFDKVVAENGRTLREYASLLGMTSQDVANLWKTDASTFFLEFTKALGGTANSAEELNGILSALGIVETREVNVLQRLSGSTELTTELMAQAGIAYSENSDLADQYAQKAETLDAKLGKLSNNLLALIAAMGSGIGEFIKPLVDLLSGFIAMVTNNPIAASFGAIALAVSAGIGIFILYKAAIAQAMASIFAMKTTMNELSIDSAQLSLSLGGLSNALGLLTGRTVQQTAAQTRLSISTKLTSANLLMMRDSLITNAASMTKGIAATGAMVGAFIALQIQSTAVNDELKKTSLNLKQIGDDANKALTDISLLQNVKLFGSWEQDYSQIQNDLKMLTLPPNLGGSVLEMFGGKSGLTQAKENIAALDTQLASLVSAGNANRAKELFDIVSSQAAESGISQKFLNEQLTEYQAALVNAPTDLKGLSDAQELAAVTGAELTDVIKNQLTESLIGANSQNVDFADSVFEFTKSLVESKGSLSIWSEAGRKANNSFARLIENLAEASGNNMAVAIQMVAAAIQQIEGAGGDASEQVQGLVERINALYGLQLDGSTVTSIAQLQALIINTGSIATSTRAEIMAMLGGGGFTDLMKQAFDAVKKSTASAGSSVKKQIRTINDFASDLKRVMSDIYDRATALKTSSDGFNMGWIDAKKKVDDAKESIKDLNDEITGINAERGILTYQLGVAEKYGDVLRVAKIKSQIAKLDKDLANKNAALKEAQDATSTSLKDNTKAAIENRELIRSQVSSAQDLIVAYASTVQANGKLPTAAMIKKYTADVVKTFTDQATAIGFSASELTEYTKIITGFGTAAGKIEKPNVKVSVDPVKTAMNAYLAEKKETKATVTPVVNTSALDALWKSIKDKLSANTIDIKLGVGSVTSTPTPGTQYGMGVGGFVPMGDNKPAATAAQISQIKDLHNKLITTKSNSKLTASSKSAQIKSLQAQIDALQLKAKFGSPYSSYASGGFVSGPGNGTSDSINARLSNGEYVIQASAVGRYGVDFLNAINQMRVTRPAASSPMASSAAAGSNVVYLSPEDRSLLRAAVDRPIALYTDNQKIAQSANAGNVLLAQRGMN